MPKPVLEHPTFKGKIVLLIQKTMKQFALWLGLALVAGVATESAWAHGERSQEPYLRTRTVQYYDVHYDKQTVKVNEEFTLIGKFRLMEDWPDSVSLPETVFLAAYAPGPMITRVESYLNGVPARQSFSKLELGRDYEFKLIMKGRVPGRHHIHPLLSVEGSGPLVGPGQWIEVTGNKADYVMPVTTMNGLKIDNIEFYGTARALKWYGVWIALAAFWLLFWLVRPLLLPRWIALNKGREDVLITSRDITVGVVLGVVVVAISFGGYIYANKEYPYVVPLQAGTNKVDPLPLPKSDVKVVVTKATYDVPGRAMYVTARMTNNGPEAVSILEFATANLRFVNLQAPGADKVISPDYPRDLVARAGMGLTDQKPLMPGETREIKFEASDAMWEVERLVSFLTDVDSKFGGLLFFVDKSGNRMMTEIGGPILPTFTAL